MSYTEEIAKKHNDWLVAHPGWGFYQSGQSDITQTAYLDRNGRFHRSVRSIEGEYVEIHKYAVSEKVEPETNLVREGASEGWDLKPSTTDPIIPDEYFDSPQAVTEEAVIQRPLSLLLNPARGQSETQAQYRSRQKEAQKLVRKLKKGVHYIFTSTQLVSQKDPATGKFERDLHGVIVTQRVSTGSYVNPARKYHTRGKKAVKKVKRDAQKLRINFETSEA